MLRHCICLVCGLKPEEIVGGSEVTQYSIPWQVQLAYDGPRRRQIHFCGGTLISSNHVLTAAHCLQKRLTGIDPDRFYVMVGEHNITTNSSDGTRHEICEHVQHPNYTHFEGVNEFNDFAILHLREAVELGTRAFPACLPTPILGGDALAGETMTVSGWGSLASEASGPDVLHSVDVVGINNTECDVAYPGRIYSNMLCAGDVDNGGVDSCQGDSGGMQEKYMCTFYKLIIRPNS